MKIKQLPEDFVVEEVASRDLKPQGPFQVFLLEKQGLDTFGAKKIIGRAFKIASQEMGVAGLKDKHALTRQFISVPARFRIPESWSEKSLSLKRVGFLDKPILIGDLQANRFTITVRDIKPDQKERLVQEAKRVLEAGVPNYFDSQRFGSLRGAEAFIAKHLIKGDYEQALKVILTSASRHDQAQVRHCRERIKSDWGSWDRCLEHCKNAPRARRERTILSFLRDNPGKFKAAFSLVERELQKMYIAAYQSFLWNECAKVALRRSLPNMKMQIVKYEAGRFEFPMSASPDVADSLRGLKIPLLHPSVEFPDDETRFSCLKALKEEGVTLSGLAVPDRENLAFKAGTRDLWVRPGNPASPVLSKDELNSVPGPQKSTSQRSKMVVSFELPPGAYATVILKAMGVVKKGRR